MTIRPFAVDYWYRHRDDTDQSIRSGAQMGQGVTCEADVYAEVARLQAQDYCVQKVVLQTTCMECSGAGRIGKAPKGTRKAKVASLPYWRLTWTTCAECKGKGFTAEKDMVI